MFVLEILKKSWENDQSTVNFQSFFFFFFFRPPPPPDPKPEKNSRKSTNIKNLA